jgi:hypothetical protein
LSFSWARISPPGHFDEWTFAYARVDVRVRVAGPHRRHDLGEVPRLDPLPRGADDVGRVDLSLDRPRLRARRRPRRAVAEVRAEEERDPAVDGALPEVHVRLEHVALEAVVAERVRQRRAVARQARVERAGPGRRHVQVLLVAVQAACEVVRAASRDRIRADPEECDHHAERKHPE